MRNEEESCNGAANLRRETNILRRLRESDVHMARDGGENGWKTTGRGWYVPSSFSSSFQQPALMLKAQET